MLCCNSDRLVFNFRGNLLAAAPLRIQLESLNMKEKKLSSLTQSLRRAAPLATRAGASRQTLTEAPE